MKTDIVFDLKCTTGYKMTCALGAARIGQKYEFIDRIIILRDKEQERHLLITCNREPNQSEAADLENNICFTFAQCERNDSNMQRANQLHEEFLKLKRTSGIKALLLFNRSTYV